MREKDLIQSTEINVLKEGRKQAVSVTVLTALWMSRCNTAAELWDPTCCLWCNSEVEQGKGRIVLAAPDSVGREIGVYYNDFPRR